MSGSSAVQFGAALVRMLALLPSVLQHRTYSFAQPSWTQRVMGIFGRMWLDRNKRKLLAAVVEAAMSGDVDAPVAEQPWWRAQITEPSAPRHLRLIARNARQIYDRAGPLLELLRSAARAEPEVEAVAQNLKEERHWRSRLSARALVEKGALRPGISAVEAARTLWTLTVPELYLRQVRELGLTADAYERWLASLLQHALLPD